MRTTDAIDPMWEGAEPTEPGPRAAAGAGWIGAVLKRVAPAVASWASGMSPELRLAWGSRVYHLRTDGLVSLRRPGPGFADNPRRNYNEAVEKRQEKAARAPDAPEKTRESVRARIVAVRDLLHSLDDMTDLSRLGSN